MSRGVGLDYSNADIKEEVRSVACGDSLGSAGSCSFGEDFVPYFRPSLAMTRSYLSQYRQTVYLESATSSPSLTFCVYRFDIAMEVTVDRERVWRFSDSDCLDRYFDP